MKILDECFEWFCLLIAFGMLALVLCGCASTAFHYADTNGNKLDGHSWRFLWQTEHVFIGIQTNGLHSIELNKTSADADSIAEFFKGANGLVTSGAAIAAKAVIP
jgi:hypothetical protein